MLSKEEKEKIIDEELFKTKLSEKGEKLSYRKKIYRFLNSAFGIWLLSSVVIGIFSYFYNENEKKNRNQEIKNEIIRKIDIEIPMRLGMIGNNYKDYLLFDGLFKTPVELAKTDLKYVFPEFKDRNILALLWELEYLVNNDEKLSIAKARESIVKMYESENSNSKPDSIKVLWDAIWINRWKNPLQHYNKN